MTPREIDALVAVKGMGWRLEKGDALFRPMYEGDAPVVRKVDKWYPPGHESSYMATPPPYSTDIAAAWKVMDRLGDDYAVQRRKDRWIVFTGYHDYIAAEADTAPMAICLAALKAQGCGV